MIRVCHMTSAHPRDDIRIFKKECCSLAQNNYDVSYVIADGRGNETINNVKIIDAGTPPTGRLRRFILKTRLVYKAARFVNADIYHFHDPDLIPTGLKLIKQGKVVIYDIHEDVPKQTYSKEYIPAILKPIIANLLKIYENFAARKFTALITATKTINDRFIKINNNSVNINNFPFSLELYENYKWSEKKNEIAYLGAIFEIRGINEIIASLEHLKCRLNLAGNFANRQLYENLKLKKGWDKVNYHGVVNRNGVKDILRISKLGLVTFHALPNHIDAMPTKMFEYMAAGIPVVASDFPLWREIIESNNCGLCVDPRNPEQIAEAIDQILNNDNKAEQMGKNGREAILAKYNWEKEAENMILLYEKFTPGIMKSV